VNTKRRLVFDTNALISAAILPLSIAAQAFTKAVQAFELITTEDAWREFEDKITLPRLRKYFASEQVLQASIDVILQSMKHVTVTTEITDCRDPDDNLFLALALDGEASLIITGDLDLLTLNPWRGVQIVKPGDFVRGLFDTVH
jgi:uncharacterized protein